MKTRSGIIYTFILLFISLFIQPDPVQVSARRVKQKLSAPASAKKHVDTRLRTYPHQKADFQPIADKITFMAYDKKASSDKETFFLDNGSKSNLNGIEIEITYLTTSGKQIHKRNADINQYFPANETSKVDIKSWDTQHSYHYINSVPSTKGSTPYKVSFRILSFKEA